MDIRPEKLDTCRQAGADKTADVSDVALAELLIDLTDGKGSDVVIDFVANERTLEGATRALGKGGRLAILGGGGMTNPFSVSGNWIKGGEREILGNKYASRSDVREALDIVARGELWPIVTETCALENVEELHQRLENGLVIGRAAVLINP